MSNNTTKEQDREKNVDEFFKKRADFFNIGAKIQRITEPRIFQLYLENISNVRNTIIISGALATMGLLIFDNQSSTLSSIANLSLQIAIILFLISILALSFYLKHFLGNGITSYKKISTDEMVTVKKATEIINDYVDGKTTKEYADKELLGVYREIEFEKIRSKPKTNEDNNLVIKMLAHVGNVFFVGAIIALIFALSYDFALHFFINTRVD